MVATVLLWIWAVYGTALFKPGYSHAAQYISELGATGTPFGWQASWLGFVPFGVSILVLLFVARGAVPLQGVGRVGYWLLSLEALAWIGSALAPCDAGCPLEGSVSQGLHNLLALVTYLGTTLAVILIGCSRGLKTSARLLLWFAATTWFLMFGAMLDPAFEPMRGTLQRVAEVVLYGSLLLLLWRCLRSVAPQRADYASA